MAYSCYLRQLPLQYSSMSRQPISVSRREFIRFAGVAAGAAVLAACAPNKPKPRPTELSSTPFPTGTPSAEELPDHKDKPPISEARFTQMVDALQNSGQPILALAGRGANLLHTTDTLPQTFPSWINPNTLPLPITVDTGESSLANFYFQLSEDDTDRFSFVAPPDINQTLWDFNTNLVTLDIHLALPPIIAVNGPLAESLFLAKEQLTLMLPLSMAQEFAKYMQLKLGGQFLDAAGVPITDQARLQRYGALAFMIQMSESTSPIWKIVDALPIFLVASTLRDLVNAGKFPENSFGMANFVEAGNMLSINKTLREKVIKIRDNWTTADTLTAHPGIFDEVLDPDIIKAVNDLNRFMYASSPISANQNNLRKPLTPIAANSPFHVSV